jgi:hypothetical protein
MSGERSCCIDASVRFPAGSLSLFSTLSGYSFTARLSPRAPLRVTSAMALPPASVSNVSSASATLQKNVVALEA